MIHSASLRCKKKRIFPIFHYHDHGTNLPWLYTAVTPSWTLQQPQFFELASQRSYSLVYGRVYLVLQKKLLALKLTAELRYDTQPRGNNNYYDVVKFFTHVQQSNQLVSRSAIRLLARLVASWLAASYHCIQRILIVCLVYLANVCTRRSSDEAPSVSSPELLYQAEYIPS